MDNFIVDIEALRARARLDIERGPVTAAYGADLERVLSVLNVALATELVCVLRYKQHHFAANGLEAGPVAAEFLAHAQEESIHCDMIAGRIAQLGGIPDFNPNSLVERAHSQYRISSDLMEMVAENLVAERIAIESYSEIISWLGDGDPTTRRMLETILSVEEEHAEDMTSLLQKSH